MCTETVQFTASSANDTALVRKRKAALVEQGESGASVARSIGVTKAAVSLVIRGKCRSPEIEAAIAKAAQRPVQELFPPKSAG